MNAEDYRSRVLACWLGKNIGGTLGAPFEWKRQVNEVSYYVQDLKGEPLPNDDLDIQLVWLIALEERGIDVSSETLADYWCLYVTPHWCEYGTGKTNMRLGLLPPLSGTVHNTYKDSCGAFIRSEIWACVAPGLPHVAARYAYEDAILDHGNGEGTYAEVFTAAVESAAFVLSDLEGLLDVGLSYIPSDCGIAQAVRTARECHRVGKTWLETREEILLRHRGSSIGFQGISERDKRLGFAEGKPGYDAPSNIGMLVTGLLFGGDDFGRVITTAVNCGEDTDCTAATAGSVFGIIHGAAAIPKKWIDPVGRTIKTACLNVGELGYYGDQLPPDVDQLTRRTERIARQVLLRHGKDLSDTDEAATSGVSASLMAVNGVQSLYEGAEGGKFVFDFFTVCVDYGFGPFIRDGTSKSIRFIVHNTYKVQANLSLHWYLPDGFAVSPSQDGYAMSLPYKFVEPLVLDYELSCGRVKCVLSRAVFEIGVEGRPTVMLIPLTLINGNVRPSEETPLPKRG